MDQKTKRTWVSVVIAIVIIVGVLAAAVVGGTAYFFYHHIDATFTAQDNADKTFEQTRARFAGQQPLIELSRDDEPVVHHPTGPRRDVQALHALVYDENSGKLTHVDVPGWLLRIISGHGNLRLADMGPMGDDEMKLRLEDLERHGPGLVMDIRRHRGSQLIVWTE
jgi:hypothetical protein